jgi:uncharacterized phage-associated protein
MHSSIAVANRFLELARERGKSLTPMQLLKLVYLAHGWMLGLQGRPLISDHVEAWQYGPVIPKLYNAIRHFKSDPVTGLLNARDTELDDVEADIVKQTFDVYGGKTGPALSRLTHMPGGPWDTVYERGSFGTDIPNDIIEDHYRQLAARAEARA